MMIADMFEGLNAMFSFVVVATTSLVGITCLIGAFYHLHKKVNNPDDEHAMSGLGILGLLFMGSLMFGFPSITEKMATAMFPDEFETSTYVQKDEAPVVKTVAPEPAPVKQYKHLIAKTDYKPYPEKEVDYTQLLIVLSSIVGGALSLVLSIVGVSKLRSKLRLRKYQKIVSNVVELNNDFVTLSEHIGTIESCLDDIKTYRVVAPTKTKSLLDGMQNILEHKKQMFNKSVREIHDMQPELKVLGGLV